MHGVGGLGGLGGPGGPGGLGGLRHGAGSGCLPTRAALGELFLFWLMAWFGWN